MMLVSSGDALEGPASLRQRGGPAMLGGESREVAGASHRGVDNGGSEVTPAQGSSAEAGSAAVDAGSVARLNNTDLRP